MQPELKTATILPSISFDLNKMSSGTQLVLSSVCLSKKKISFAVHTQKQGTSLDYFLATTFTFFNMMHKKWKP